MKAAGLIFVSGTAPHDPATGAIRGETIQEQTRQSLTNVAVILEEAGSSLDKIVSATVVLADEEEFAGMNEEWLRWLSGESSGTEGIDRGDCGGLKSEKQEPDAAGTGYRGGAWDGDGARANGGD